MTAQTPSNKPGFNFSTPKGYDFALEKGLIGFNESALDPWYYLKSTDTFNPTDRWPQGPSKDQLVAFARRYDNDDIACFAVKNGAVSEVVVIEGWQSNGYEIIDRYGSFWEWMKSIIDDIAEIVEDDD